MSARYDGFSSNHDDDGDAIEEAAVDWLMQREEGFSPAQTREFELWRRADPRHAAAFARLEQTCALLEKMPLIESTVRSESGTHGSLRAFDDRSNRRVGNGALHRINGFRAIALGVAAAVVLAAVGWWQWAGADPDAVLYTTSADDYERVTLADGSVLELNADSEVQVTFSARERRVTLKAGEAHFNVAPDTTRPFVVGAGAVSVRAVGTAFNVRLANAAVEILVTEGKVKVGQTSVSTPGIEQAASTEMPLVQAGERAVVTRLGPVTPPRVEKVEPTAIRQALAWQERYLVFSETPLREVVARFNRHSSGRRGVQLFIGDAELAERPVGGTFAADNVKAFVRLLESSGDIVAEERGEREIVLRRAPLADLRP